MAEWACVLCKAGGRESGPRRGRSAICQDHTASLAAQGRAWCSIGLHVVRAGEMKRRGCASCARMARQASYQRNAERERERSRETYRADPERVYARRRAWAQANPERERQTARARHARYRARHAERLAPILRERARAYHRRNRDRLLVAMRERRVRRILRILQGAPRAR